MTLEMMEAIEAILAKGDRAELIPTKDGVRIVRIRRETVDPGGRPAPRPTAPKTPAARR